MTTFKNIALLVLSLGLVFAIFRGCHNEQAAKDTITALKLQNQKSDSVINTKGQTIAQQDVIIVNNTQALSDLTDSLFALKKSDAKKIKDVIAFYSSITHIKLDSVIVPYVDTEATKRFADSVAAQCEQVIAYYDANTITVPRTASDTTADYTATIRVEQRQTKLSLQLAPDTQYIRFTTTKGGLFKKDAHDRRHFWLKKQTIVQVKHTNKLVELASQNSIIYQPPKNLHLARSGILIGIGVVLGTFL